MSVFFYYSVFPTSSVSSSYSISVETSAISSNKSISYTSYTSSTDVESDDRYQLLKFGKIRRRERKILKDIQFISLGKMRSKLS